MVDMRRTVTAATSCMQELRCSEHMDSSSVERTSRSTRTCWFVELSCACGSMYNNAIKEDVHVGLQAHIHQVPRTTTSRNKEREHGTALEMDFL